MDINSITSGSGFGSTFSPIKGVSGDTDFANILENIKRGAEQPVIPKDEVSMLTSPGINNQRIGTKSGNSFGDFVKEIINDVNDLQIDSGDKTEMFVKGEPIDLHEVMIASNKAKTSFQLLLELRNKGLDLYREVSRMQS
ncbi:hypothetical protein MASR1M45_30130 [Candidatus Kapaibacterium sp.]